VTEKNADDHWIRNRFVPAPDKPDKAVIPGKVDKLKVSTKEERSESASGGAVGADREKVERTLLSSPSLREPAGTESPARKEPAPQVPTASLAQFMASTASAHSVASAQVEQREPVRPITPENESESKIKIFHVLERGSNSSPQSPTRRRRERACPYPTSSKRCRPRRREARQQTPEPSKSLSWLWSNANFSEVDVQMKCSW